jgi:hypothetical protein
LRLLNVVHDLYWSIMKNSTIVCIIVLHAPLIRWLVFIMTLVKYSLRTESRSEFRPSAGCFMEMVVMVWVRRALVRKSGARYL